MDWYTNYNLTADQVPIDFDLPWNTGSYNSFGWICYIVVTILGVLINGVTFLLMVYNPNVKKLDSVPFVIYLVVEDFLFSLVCFIQCCINLHHSSQFGDSLGCKIEAWQVTYFMSITGLSLCLIAYTMRKRVTTILDVQNPPIFKIQVIFWIMGGIFATGGTVWPGKARLNLSGTFCVPSYEEVFPAVFFFGVNVFPTVVFLAVQYSWIFIYYRRITKHDLMRSRKQLKLARQLAVFVVVYFLFYTPFLLSAIYEWSTKYFAVVSFDIIAGIFTHMASVANPVMYLWVTKPAREEMKKFFGFIKGTRSPTPIPAKSENKDDGTHTSQTATDPPLQVVTTSYYNVPLSKFIT